MFFIINNIQCMWEKNHMEKTFKNTFVCRKEDQQFEDGANVEYKRNFALLDNKLKIIPDQKFIMLEKVLLQQIVFHKMEK